jgi:aminoglycoside 3-N-acetyltransferase I
MDAVQVRRLGRDETETARRLFVMMAEVFAERARPLGDDYLRRLLARDDFWALAAFAGDGDGDDLVGGLTAHTLPMTRDEVCEIFIYDIAIRSDRQRQGVGRRLIETLRAMAARQGLDEVFVPADADDDAAIAFYRALGGKASPAMIFDFSPDDD